MLLRMTQHPEERKGWARIPLAAFRAWAEPSPIEFLPYNPAACAKYPPLGRAYPFCAAR